MEDLICQPVNEDNEENHEGGDQDEPEFGSVRPTTLTSPYTPTRQERMEHELTHIPYRSWCDHCVRGKCAAMAHRKSTLEDDRKIPVVGVDYAFLKRSDETGDVISEVKTMVIKDGRSKAVFPIPVLQKGLDADEYSTRNMLRVLDFMGYAEVILKSDQETALDKVIESAKIHRGPGTQTMTEKSPVGDSKSNGLVERANREVEGQVRTMASALEGKLGRKIPADSSVLPWLVLHSGTLLRQFSVGKDGKTPHQRLRGRKSKRQLLEFGETVHFMPLDALDKPNTDSRYIDGVWLGLRMGTEEYLVGNKDGVFKARTVRRKPPESRWDFKQVSEVMGTPWKPYNFSDDDKLRIRVPGVTDSTDTVERQPMPEGLPPKRVRIERRDLERLGYTPACPGCYNAKHGRAHRPHTQFCRDRVQQAMGTDPELRKRVDAVTERENRWIEAQHERTMQSQNPMEQEESIANDGQSSPRATIPSGAEGEVVEKDEDTNDFYMEVNEDIADRIAEDAAIEIDRLSNADSNQDELMGIVNTAMAKILKCYRPPSELPGGDVLGVLRDASMMGSPHVSEIYSPPRVCALADKFGMRPGFSLDLTVCDAQGNPWDFDKVEMRKKARELVREQKPTLLIGSPMCRAFSLLQGLNKLRIGPEKWKAMIEHGRMHLEFMCELYHIQAGAGRYFLHEHPAGASSWKEDCTQRCMRLPRSTVVQSDLCGFGMTSQDMHGPGLVKKPTKFMTNSHHVAKWLEVKCTGDHRHVQLIGGRAKACEIYPTKLCEAMLRGLKDQLVADGRLCADGSLMLTGHEDDKPEDWGTYYDDMSNLPLRTDLVRKARQEEMDVFAKFPVYKKVPIADSWHHTGKGPIGTKWVDINKGDLDEPEYRSRLVAKEIKRKNDEDIFAATPPLEAKKLLFSLATTGTKNSKNPLKLLFIDVKRAYFYARAKRPVFVQLPDEDYEEGQCGRLEVSMYGTRDAAANWEAEYTGMLMAEGFAPGLATPCAFYNAEHDVRCVVHGDDFTFLGTDSSLDWIQTRIQEHYEVKIRGRLGPHPKDDKVIRILNRIVEWTQDGVCYECDQRHAEIIVNEVGLGDSKATVTTPGVKVKVDEDNDSYLEGEQASKYRRLAARANFIAIDRQDIQFAVKELARGMANPKESDWQALIRMAKYLKKRPRYAIWFRFQPMTRVIVTSTDADWAGEHATRKSTSGGIMQLGQHVLKSWASTQSVIALSSGESEFYSIVKGASQSLGLQALMSDLNIRCGIKLLTDATTGKSIASRRGLGKVRHVEVANLWIQQKVADETIDIQKIKICYNPSDMLTKHLSEENMRHCMELIGAEFLEGRSHIAPSLSMLSCQPMLVMENIYWNHYKR